MTTNQQPPRRPGRATRLAFPWMHWALLLSLAITIVAGLATQPVSVTSAIEPPTATAAGWDVESLLGHPVGTSVPDADSEPRPLEDRL